MMELNFDKEIDALLRQSAQESEDAFAARDIPHSAHLDADEISAFAENALPEKNRQGCTMHLADCDRCRKILSNLISLNSDSESEIVHAEEKEIGASPIPWYRKLFAFPNLAYTLGALILIFAGLGIFTILQNGDAARNAEVSQISEQQPNGKGMSSDGGANPAEESRPNAMSNSMSSNTTFNRAAISNSSASVSNSAMPAAPPVAAANSNMPATRNEEDKNLQPAPKPTAPQKEPVDLAKTEDSVAAGAVSPKENNLQLDEAERQNQASENSVSQRKTANLSINGRSVQTAPMATTRAETKDKKAEELKDDATEKSAEAATTVGGKTFKRANNVWVDSAYRGQPTTNISRGTKEYKKLDKDLRRIVENLGGTVIVVWKEKAYRIQ
ncbi:MAG: zf-HC2 domain-containing protein [Pyrinomonadaceae bacterium]